MAFVVEPAFIQAPEHRPKPTITEAAGGIPLIDLSPLLHYPIPVDGGAAPPAVSAMVAEVEAACREWGFFQVINHGVPSELLDNIMAAAKGFFALPMEEKRQVKRDKAKLLGYDDTEHTKNVRDWKEVFDFIFQDPAGFAEPGTDEYYAFKNQWPKYPPSFKEACETYATAANELAFKLLELIALTLGLPAKRLNGFFKDQSSFMRLNYYPPCPSPHLALGLNRHKDAGVLTILAQDDVEGLDVKRRSDGEWIRVKPIPNSYVINVGDIVQVWSNDKYESAEHRVCVNSEKARCSVPFFFNPAHYVTVQPLEELIDEKNSPAKYNAYNWGEFFKTRKNSNFKKPGGENIQIYHFKKAE
ncbi:protein DMR6-LIKE OXYGENASE 2 isoform X5 [Elaeis guineensis]|uniref:Protein DMR6-LIKE OXYGENASE 2-like n=2 Tax=Elaeis guineensis var. tenera TaxID=51953 RepID=A0A6J0PSM5_ELAGV|nr:protein DMR6-LIKE OXYGENASE 2-like [Elaeis guineensis]XP_019711266.1 protein DMR6-LIKE OXYGENASE 2-like [Elaeis guineensis]